MFTGYLLEQAQKRVPTAFRVNGRTRHIICRSQPQPAFLARLSLWPHTAAHNSILIVFFLSVVPPRYFLLNQSPAVTLVV